jgi:hypothetical protein
MRNHLDQFIFPYAVLHGEIEIKAQLVWTIHRDQGRHSCETTVALREFRALPDFVEKYTVC